MQMVSVSQSSGGQHRGSVDGVQTGEQLCLGNAAAVHQQAAPDVLCHRCTTSNSAIGPRNALCHQNHLHTRPVTTVHGYGKLLEQSSNQCLFTGACTRIR